MTSQPAPPVTGIVFRRLRTPGERRMARRLLADGGVPAAPSPRHDGEVLFGLWDLAAPDPEALVAAAATGPAAPGSVELHGIVVRAGLRQRGLGRRLVAEVADALRSEGAERVVARPAGGQGPAAGLLARAGFVAAVDAAGRPAGTDGGWRYLEL